jgi:EAL domain
MDHRLQETAAHQTFGQRRIVPIACIVDAKQHIRTFLGAALEEFGFVVFECSQLNELAAALEERKPNLVVIGFSSGAIEVSETVSMLAATGFGGSVLLVGPHNSPMVTAVRELGAKLDLTLLPTLSTPFDNNHLRESVASFLPIEAPRPAVDAAETLRSGWLELWYQPKVDAKKLALQGADALIRMRHPSWGVIEPAYFIPDSRDPHMLQLSEFVIRQAIADWRYFLTQYGSIDIAINLPISFLQKPDALEYLYQQLPDHPAFAGF